ncbi:hypothetical protein CRG98_038580 [Punica granatum]|uniref:Glycosyltransferase n=1 Tax=Punica granatum TaxID=22663 RepID=A0A2I0IAM3_PUNGR|nr:hypothetical protein CRG98_038580 [Punica granatum]
MSDETKAMTYIYMDLPCFFPSALSACPTRFLLTISISPTQSQQFNSDFYSSRRNPRSPIVILSTLITFRLQLRMSGKAELVFIPGPGVGHLLSAVEMAKLLVGRDEGLSVTVLVMKLTDSSDMNSIADSVSASSSTGRIRFIELPRAELQNGSPSLVSFLNAVEAYKSHVRDVVRGLADSGSGSASPRLAGFVVDMFCAPMIDVANEFSVPSYLFFTSSATFLGAMLHLQALQDDCQQDIGALVDSEATVDYPGLANPLNIKLYMPSELRKKDISSLFLGLAKRFRETKGIVVNTFEELEQRAVEAVFDDKLPLLYPVGPILTLKGGSDDKLGSGDIVKWLDDQPPESVLFLCFGSMGSFREDQVRQIAHALERSVHRFLWSLRRPPPGGKFDVPQSYDDPNEVLPEGFLERTAGQGKVIGWAPQVEVLAHPAVGGFVSHCGWNSTLESIWFGVPVAAWPMYAEQHFNAYALVEELGVAVEIRMDYRKGDEVTVTAEEIERGIRRLMETEREDKKEKVRLMSEKSRRALMEGGSSHSNLGRDLKCVD